MDKPPDPASPQSTSWADIVAWAEEDQGGDHSQEQEENSQASKYGSRICSDHSPIMGCGISVPKPSNMPFKFFSM
ncbi:hypothetical protein IFM89_024124 [Coptis chinensis]|uniref:Uncharacterized protein n=1 Tax=Coptis chinensis TaxID=261450 RepID=A0A835LJC9_9MAGN|nr:hypothetical protein IFM89_024124 [Coptis chinensis]